jgi:hypothetical protein
VEILREIARALWGGVLFLIDFVSEFLALLLSALLNVEVEANDARALAAIIVFFTLLYIIRQILVRLMSNMAQRPLTITLYTQQTPAQVVAGDRSNRILGVLFLVALFIFLYALGVAFLDLPPLF